MVVSALKLVRPSHCGESQSVYLSNASNPIQAIDTDNSKTIELNELKDAFAKAGNPLSGNYDRII